VVKPALLERLLLAEARNRPAAGLKTQSVSSAGAARPQTDLND
jgi:hypothetical protein